MTNRVEQRRYARAPLGTPGTFSASVTATGEDHHPATEGVCKDISLGGMFLQTRSPAPFNAQVTIYTRLPGAERVIPLPGVVRWVSDGGMGVQFGLLGAVETYLITEIGRKHTGE